MAKVTNLKIALQNGTDSTLYATWAFKEKNLNHYLVKWTYYTAKSKVAFDGGSSKITAKQATYNAPSNAVSVKVSVKPVSKTHKVTVSQNDPGGPNGYSIDPVSKKTVTKSYWTGVAVSKLYQMAKNPPATPSAPTVTVSNYKLTAILDTQDSLTDQVEFYIIVGNRKFKSAVANLNKTSRRASYSCNISAGSSYRVRCRAINLYGKSKAKIYSGWSEYSSEAMTIPSAVSGVKCSVDSKTSVVLTWNKNTTATSYEVEYTTNKAYFGTSSEVSSTTSQTNRAYVTGLDPGNRYYFRVRAVNGQGESSWSGIVDTILGSTPEAPTTWSSTTTAVVGETVRVYWVHNCEDGSREVDAQLDISTNAFAGSITRTIPNDRGDGEIGSTNFIFDSPSARLYSWRMRTKGITGEYGPWSVIRTITLYDPPTLAMELGEILESFPFSIKLTPGPATQNPISYHISITAEETHVSTDPTGEEVLVNAGEEIYSDTYYPFPLTDASEMPQGLSVVTYNILAGEVYLQNDQIYKVTAVVSMDSGLTAEASDTFTVSWSDTLHDADASIVIVWDTLTAQISPFCRDEEENLVPDVTLSVYRRESDGSFTEIATDLANDGSVTVTDPHPALDYARYRITVRDKHTGVVSYEDLPGEPVLESSIVIQWDGAWTEYDYSGEDAPELPTWTGSMVWLPWNVDIDENNDPDVSLVKYIGRKHPVSYYGTQQGYSASWSAEIDKSDKDTIYALRRLAAWPGDVYVREPSGTGYWAHVTVSMSINHCELVVPVRLDVKRVEGGRP